MDILEIATVSFGNRDECCRKLEVLKWKGLYQLNRDITEMQIYECDLNHLAKLEEFMRVKGSRRICEADEIYEMKRQEEIQRCESEIARHDALLEAIFRYAGSEKVFSVTNNFDIMEIQNFSVFTLLCECLQESIVLRRDLDILRQRIVDQRDINQGRQESESLRIREITAQLDDARIHNQELVQLNTAADETIVKVLKGINELVALSRCIVTPLLSLLGNHKETTKWNVTKFLRIFEAEVKSIIEVVYGAVKPPAPTPKAKKPAPAAKLVADPIIQVLMPNKIHKLVPYQPCAYCVEDYMMNLVFETPAVPATPEYVQQIFHVEDVNTKFGIYTLTIPAKRHPYRGPKKD